MANRNVHSRKLRGINNYNVIVDYFNGLSKSKKIDMSFVIDAFLCLYESLWENKGSHGLEEGDKKGYSPGPYYPEHKAMVALYQLFTGISNSEVEDLFGIDDTTWANHDDWLFNQIQIKASRVKWKHQNLLIQFFGVFLAPTKIVEIIKANATEMPDDFNHVTHFFDGVLLKWLNVRDINNEGKLLSLLKARKKNKNTGLGVQLMMDSLLFWCATSEVDEGAMHDLKQALTRMRLWEFMNPACVVMFDKAYIKLSYEVLKDMQKVMEMRDKVTEEIMTQSGLNTKQRQERLKKLPDVRILQRKFEKELSQLKPIMTEKKLGHRNFLVNFKKQDSSKMDRMVMDLQKACGNRAESRNGDLQARFKRLNRLRSKKASFAKFTNIVRVCCCLDNIIQGLIRVKNKLYLPMRLADAFRNCKEYDWHKPDFKFLLNDQEMKVEFDIDDEDQFADNCYLSTFKGRIDVKEIQNKLMQQSSGELEEIENAEKEQGLDYQEEYSEEIVPFGSRLWEEKYVKSVRDMELKDRPAVKKESSVNKNVNAALESSKNSGEASMNAMKMMGSIKVPPRRKKAKAKKKKKKKKKKGPPKMKKKKDQKKGLQQELPKPVPAPVNRMPMRNIGANAIPRIGQHPLFRAPVKKPQVQVKKTPVIQRPPEAKTPDLANQDVVTRDRRKQAVVELTKETARCIWYMRYDGKKKKSERKIFAIGVDVSEGKDVVRFSGLQLSGKDYAMVKFFFTFGDPGNVPLPHVLVAGYGEGNAKTVKDYIVSRTLCFPWERKMVSNCSDKAWEYYVDQVERTKKKRKREKPKVVRKRQKTGITTEKDVKTEMCDQ